MKRFVVLFCIFPFLFLIVLFLLPCNEYAKEEVTEIRKNFESFDNNENFVASGDFNCIYLSDKVIKINELDFQGNKFNRALGFDDKYCYLYYESKISKDNYALNIIKLYYDNLSMEKVWSISDVNKDVVAWKSYQNDKVCFSSGDKYCVFDLVTGDQAWSDKKDLSWQVNNYTFNIPISSGCSNKDQKINITNNVTGQTKVVSWKNDLSAFEEGRYIKKFDGRFKYTPSCFIGGTEKDNMCYLVGKMPLDSQPLTAQIILFTYDFTTSKLDYYSSFEYSGYTDPIIEIIYR